MATQQEQSSPNKFGLERDDSPYSKEECEDIIGKLEALMDGELEDESEQEVRKMIEDCEYCMEQYNLERSIRGIIKNGFNNVFASQNLLTNIRDKIKSLGSSADDKVDAGDQRSA